MGPPSGRSELPHARITGAECPLVFGNTMAQAGSQNTTPSPSNTHADMVDADEQAQRQKAIDTFLARTEFSKLARVLRARLSYASYKATHNIAHVPLTSLEHQLASRPTPDPAHSPTRKLTHTTTMPPPPAQQDNSRIWRSAGMSLYQAVLDPGPPTRRSRPQANGPQTNAPAVNGRERLAIPGRTVRNVPRRRHAHALSTEREDITAATTLTAIMRAGAATPATLSRTSSASSASRTPQPDDAQAAELMLFLATSPSPARPTPRQPGLVPPRLLFPSSSDPAQLPTPESSQPTHSTPPQRPIGSFNLGDYINVSPSPGAFPRAESMVPIQGRRLFDDERR
ncbi:unnamed protein product [Rhizoctonia solani]|uniref:Uncharacterized protein n=2 Tax=Rhizoctonia solani AG-3 TaxID=1086053 RepID=A0A074S627_9AGAM|nr:hypothetical protein RSOL_207080 [Rhizoctonia solani AG-3 Rhs1AP]KEP53070.1 hypothetical protein V565_036010 [Rhizoctonia solani 123E]CAE6505556.1 unnamed protein product [Rhizoctonia solani]